MSEGCAKCGELFGCNHSHREYMGKRKTPDKLNIPCKTKIEDSPMTKTYDPESYRAGLEAAANVARDGCLVPPDGGSPTEEEAALCDEIARRIRNVTVPESKQTPHVCEYSSGQSIQTVSDPIAFFLKAAGVKAGTFANFNAWVAVTDDGYTLNYAHVNGVQYNKDGSPLVVKHEDTGAEKFEGQMYDAKACVWRES